MRGSGTSARARAREAVLMVQASSRRGVVLWAVLGRVLSRAGCSGLVWYMAEEGGYLFAYEGYAGYSGGMGHGDAV